MNLGIYKPGQGFAIRIMTAVLIGLFTTGLAVFLYNQSLVFAERLPKSTYRVALDTPPSAADIKPGDAVELVTRPDASGVLVVATGVVASVDQKLLTVESFKPVGALDPSSAGGLRKVALDPATPAQVFTVPRGGVQGDAPVSPTLLGGGVAAFIILAGTVLGYWFVGMRPGTVEFLIATDFEMKKVNWSTPREIIGHTWVVIGACIMLAIILFAVDQVFKNSFTLIDLLPRAGQETRVVK